MVCEEGNMSNVTRFPGITRLDLSPDVLLKEAMGELDSCIILGYKKDGSEFFASSVADGGDVVWHLERAKHKLMKVADDMGNS